jgi:hypothetical protein
MNDRLPRVPLLPTRQLCFSRLFLKRYFVSEDGIKDNDELAGKSGQGDLCRFVPRTQRLIEALEAAL